MTENTETYAFLATTSGLLLLTAAIAHALFGILNTETVNTVLSAITFALAIFGPPLLLLYIRYVSERTIYHS